MVYQYKQLELPFGLLTDAYQVEYAGRAILKGMNVAILHLTDKEGPPMTVYVDMDRFYIVKVSGTFTIGSASTELAAEFDDFRIVEGMPFPYLITNYAGGQKIGETHISEYKINQNMNPSLFREKD